MSKKTVRVKRKLSKFKLNSHLVYGAIIIVLYLCTRLYNIGQPSTVSWDEAHFGKHINWYIQDISFFDVHPPLGKLLYAFIGNLTNYKGNFSFEKPGMKYSNNFYAHLRIFSVYVGHISILFIYLITYEICNSRKIAMISVMLVLADTSTTIINRFILLDSPLISLILMTIYFYFKSNYAENVYKFRFMILTGVSLGLACSVKFVGIFTFLNIGFLSSMNLYYYCKYHSANKALNSALKKLFGYLFVSIIVYLCVFQIHFKHQKFSDDSSGSDSFYSLRYQSQLDGSFISRHLNASRYLRNNSIIMLKSCRPDGIFLHSHPFLYPEFTGAIQQQVTGFQGRDYNNYWEIIKVNGSESEYIEDKDVVKLIHHRTLRNLHSHIVASHSNKDNFQVSCYGENGIGDDNDNWIIVKINENENEISSITSKIRLIHQNYKCELFGSKDRLPEWGFFQEEIVCNTNKGHHDSCWSFIFKPDAEDAMDISYLVKPTFFQKIIDVHYVMFRMNNELIPKYSEVTSKPWQWPINYKGIWFSIDEKFSVYLLGNPIIYWICLFCIILFPFMYIYTEINLKNKNVMRKLWVIYTFWIFNYIPYFFMQRVLYFHHYLPSFYLSTIITGIFIGNFIKLVCLDLTRQRVVYKRLKFIFILGFIIILWVSFYCFKFLVYGMDGERASIDPTNSKYSKFLWLKSWEF